MQLKLKSYKKKKAQSAMEFILLASFMLLVIIGFFAVASSKALEAKENSDRKIADDIASFFYREIEIAGAANDGYSRIFTMQQNINGADYSIKIIDNREIIINYLDYENVRFLPLNLKCDPVSACSDLKGKNKIFKKGGILSISKA